MTVEQQDLLFTTTASLYAENRIHPCKQRRTFLAHNLAYKEEVSLVLFDFTVD